MEKYEYKVVEKTFNPKAEEEAINFLATDRWELICVTCMEPETSTTRLYFKRKRETSD